MAEKARQMDAYSPEKPELAYVIAHTYKHQIWGLLGIKAQESKQPAVHTASLFFLWDQRERPDYLERSGEQKKLLSELLDLPTEPMDMDSIFGRLTERRNAFYDFAELAEVTPVPSGVPIAVPRADTLVTPGLLTDVVACAAEQLREDVTIREMSDEGSEISGLPAQDIKKMLLSNASYNLFVIGHVLPHIAAGTEDEKASLRILSQLADIKRLPEHRKRLEELFGKTH